MDKTWSHNQRTKIFDIEKDESAKKMLVEDPKSDRKI
jgi:hypothetical protein